MAYRTSIPTTLISTHLISSVGLVVLVLSSGCLTEVDPAATVRVSCPPAGDPEGEDPYKDFRPVSNLLENRCGNLDCHGDAARPLKLYGSIGLRARLPEDVVLDDPEEYFSGGQVGTTDFELELNYRSVCGLEPEKLSLVMKGELEPDDLTFIRKPKLGEKHKGGAIWESGKPGDFCLTNYVKAKFDPGTFNGSSCLEELGQ
jgi:hypothetical protein